MALSPADFYAYSRATGVQVPEDPEERAEMAPEVLEFRRNQLKAPESELVIAGLRGYGPYKNVDRQILEQQRQNFLNAEKTEPNALQILGTTALAAGAAIGAGLAGRRFLRGRTELPKAPSRSANQGVVQQDLSNLRRAAAVVEPASEPVAPSRPAPGTTENALAIDPTDRLLQELGEMQASRKKELTSRMSQAYGQRLEKTADELLEQLRFESVDLTTIQAATENLQRSQFANAVESGEDQMTGRMKSQLQRNEDYDMSQVEILENIASQNQRAMMEEADPSQVIGYEPDAAINQVASQLPDGLPIDQSEVTASNFAKKQIMQTRMNQLRAQLSQEGYRGLALEKELASRTNIKQAAELYAATGDPNVLDLAQETPSLPLTVKPKTNLQLGQSKTSFINEEIPTSSYYEPFKEREIESGGLVNADIYYTNKLSNLNAKLEGVSDLIDNPEYTNFIEQTNMAMFAMRQGDPTAAKVFARNKALLDQGKAPQPVIKNPEYTLLQNQITYAEQARTQIRDKQNALVLQAQRFPSVQKLTQTGEGSRLFAEVDPSTGELIPETIELRSGRPGLPGGTVSATATGRAIRGRVGAEGTTAGSAPGIFEPPAIVTEQTFKPETARFRGETSRGEYTAADAGKGLEYEAQPVRWDPDIHLPEQRTPEGFVYSEEAMLKPSQPLGRERTLGAPKSPRAVAQASVNLSEAVRKGEVQFPRQQTVQQSSIDPQKYFETPSLFVKPQPKITETRQLNLPSDVVPSTAVAAKVRLTPADLAAQQLESYMSKLQRGRSTPLTSQAVIQPRLF